MASDSAKRKVGAMLGEETAKPLPEPSGSVFDEYAGDAFDAFKAGDRAGFASALKSAIHACYGEEE